MANVRLQTFNSQQIFPQNSPNKHQTITTS